MSQVQITGLRDPDMQRALARALHMMDEAKKHPNPERDREQLRRLVNWVQSRIDASEIAPEDPDLNTERVSVIGART